MKQNQFYHDNTFPTNLAVSAQARGKYAQYITPYIQTKCPKTIIIILYYNGPFSILRHTYIINVGQCRRVRSYNNLGHPPQPAVGR